MRNLAEVVTKEQVTAALEFFINNDVRLIPSTKFDLVYMGKKFPPKEVVRKAAELGGIKNWQSYRLNGGDPTNVPLKRLGFEIVNKGEKGPLSLTLKQFIDELIGYVDGLNPSAQFGKFHFAVKDEKTSFGTAGGAWDAEEYPGYVFTDGKKSYLLRLINYDQESYIVFESIHSNSQLINYKLIQGYNFKHQNGVIYITETYLMTVKSRVSFDVAKRAMKQSGFTSDDIISSFEEDQFDKQQVIKDLLEWAEIREQAKSLIKNEMVEDDQPENKINELKQELMYPLNTILYGPPGTGKTYNTILRAVQIIEPVKPVTNYDAAKAIFKKQIGDQAEFVTFHQNYSYEDFVAGLRPDVDAASIGLRFVEHKGIFYKICERAKNNFNQYKSGQTYIEPSFEEVLEELLEPLEIGDEIELKTIARNVNFHITANNGKNLSFRKQSGGTGHTLSISTMKAMYEGRREFNMQGVGIYLRPVVERLKEMARGKRKETGRMPLKNYVLIIDEINRANISRVFGELITLIEPDKRLGATHELKLRLPGLPEDELFSVPPNLYILGTMNTADKSIALIDIALRRRFVFEDMYPRPEKVDELVKPPYNEFLKILNSVILEKKGADFLIGHSYLMAEDGKELDFASVINQKIIPLLNEYFYNHRGISVFDLLKPAIDKVPGFTIEKDDYIGVTCKKA